MKNLSVFIRKVLIEGKVQDLEKKYVINDDDDDDTIDYENKLLKYSFNQLVNADPSPTKKYLEWMIKQRLADYKLLSHTGKQNLMILIAL